MKVGLGKSCKTKINRGPLRATFEICAKVKVYGTPGTGGGDESLRLLEDGYFRLLEDGSFRLLE